MNPTDDDRSLSSRPAGKPWHGVDHAENFPVGSWLVPAALRPAVFAIYRFARHADDIADEGTDAAPIRLARLEALHEALRAAARAAGDEPRQQGDDGGPMTVREPVVQALVAPVRRHALGWHHFHDLLDAFQQDLVVSRYADAAAVDDYCARSAHPIGRLMLELFDAATSVNLASSDAICGALQKINFLQDIAIDRAKDRIYVPLATLGACGVTQAQWFREIDAGGLSSASREAVAIEARRAGAQLRSGAVLTAAVPRRLGWELRFILAGGLRILDRLQRVGYDAVTSRPVLGWRDAPALLSRALRMSSPEPDDEARTADATPPGRPGGGAPAAGRSR